MFDELKDCILHDEENFKISDIQFNNSNNSSTDTGEYRNLCALWRAVILQAIIDSVSNSSRTEDRLAKNSAIAWFDDQSYDFKIVCQFAEYDRKYVKKKALFVIDNRKKNKTKHLQEGDFYCA